MAGARLLASVFHPLNWYSGWSLMLAGFLVGAVIGLRFHREDFGGGYGSFRRRIVRLGHVALGALGLMNVIFSMAVGTGGRLAGVASVCLLAGGIAMPVVCFLTGWREGFRQLFVVPVVLLVSAIILILLGGMP